MTDREQIAALTARAERAETLLGERRMCLNCGRTAPASHDRNTPLDDCLSDDACSFDMTPDEAWQHWRRVAHELRVRAEAAEAALLEKNAALTRATFRADIHVELLHRLRHEITEASHPEFIWGAMDNVSDMDVTLNDYARAASRAIRAAVLHPAPSDQGRKGGD